MMTVLDVEGANFGECSMPAVMPTDLDQAAVAKRSGRTANGVIGVTKIITAGDSLEDTELAVVEGVPSAHCSSSSSLRDSARESDVCQPIVVPVKAVEELVPVDHWTATTE